MEDIAQWMASNRLKLNPAKTDFMRYATRRRQHQLSNDHVTFAGSAIRPSSTVRDLGVVLDSKLVRTSHLPVSLPSITLDKELCSSPIDGRQKTVVNISRVDYCNSLLAGVPRYQLDRLQSALNSAARLIVGAKKLDHIK